MPKRTRNERQAVCLAVEAIRALREFLAVPKRRGRLKARQRRRFHSTVQALRTLEASPTNPVHVPAGVVRNILWCLAQVTEFSKTDQWIRDAVLGRE
jgi:hypothetical protein